MNDFVDIEARAKILKLEEILSHVRAIKSGPLKGTLVGDESYDALREYYVIGFKEE
jgi:hypothetical protein